MNRHYGCYNSFILFYWSAGIVNQTNKTKKKSSFQLFIYILFDLIENYEISSFFTACCGNFQQSRLTINSNAYRFSIDKMYRCFVASFAYYWWYADRKKRHPLNDQVDNVTDLHDFHFDCRVFYSVASNGEMIMKCDNIYFWYAFVCSCFECKANRYAHSSKLSNLFSLVFLVH